MYLLLSGRSAPSGQQVQRFSIDGYIRLIKVPGARREETNYGNYEDQ